MDDWYKIMILQYHIKLLEGLLIEANKKSGFLQSTIEDLNSSEETTRLCAKRCLITRGIGINRFLHDENESIRAQAKEMKEIYNDPDPLRRERLNKPYFLLEDETPTHIVAITENMFLPQTGGING